MIYLPWPAGLCVPMDLQSDTYCDRTHCFPTSMRPIYPILTDSIVLHVGLTVLSLSKKGKSFPHSPSSWCINRICHLRQKPKYKFRFLPIFILFNLSPSFLLSLLWHLSSVHCYASVSSHHCSVLENWDIFYLLAFISDPSRRSPKTICNGCLWLFSIKPMTSE